MPALAGLLLVTAWVMSEPHRWPERMRAPPAERYLLLLTMVLTVLADLAMAIAIGTVIGLALRHFGRVAPPEDWKPPER